jgi:hypothetical protein
MNHQNESVAWDALKKRMLALGYLLVTFQLKVRPHLATLDLLQATKKIGNKCAFGLRERNHFTNHPKVSITGGTYFTFNFVLLPIKGK